MCQHWERGPHAQLISAISLIAFCAIFVGSAFVIRREAAEAEKEEERQKKKEREREQEERCHSNSNCPSSLFAFVRGQSAMIRRSPLHFMARPPLQHPHTHTLTVTVIGCCDMDRPRRWFLCGIPERTHPPHTHIHTSPCYHSLSVIPQWLSHTEVRPACALTGLRGRCLGNKLPFHLSVSYFLPLSLLYHRSPWVTLMNASLCPLR